VPVVLVCTTPFRPLAAALLPTLGVPELRLLTVGHPLSEVQAPILRERASAAMDDLWQLLE
jgi:hypothetical protein